MSISVLHIDTESSWRGGQQQALYLHKGLTSRGINSYFACKSNSELSKIMAEDKIAHKELPFRSEIDIFSSFKIAYFVRKNSIDIIHCHSSHSLSIGLLASLFCRVKVIASRRVDFPIKLTRLNKIKYSHKNLKKIICISSEIYQVMAQSSIPQSKLSVIHSGIDIHRFANFSSETLSRELNPDSRLVIGTVAAFEGHKDYPTFLKAIQIIIQSNPEVLFVAVGSGKKFELMRELAKQLNIMDNIIFAGFRKNTGDFLKLFDIFTLFSKKEGLGTSILDAMSVGLPIVASDAGGIPEIVREDYNGYLFERGNPEQLAEKLLLLIDNKDSRLKMGKNSLELVREFSIEKTIDKNLALYREVLESIR